MPRKATTEGVAGAKRRMKPSEKAKASAVGEPVAKRRRGRPPKSVYANEDPGQMRDSSAVGTGRVLGKLNEGRTEALGAQVFLLNVRLILFFSTHLYC